MAQPAINTQLQVLLDGISDSKAKTALSNLLNSTVDLVVMYNALASGSSSVQQVTKIEFNPLVEDKSAYFQGGVIHLGLGYVKNDNNNDINSAKLADVLGHEGQHGIFSPESQTASSIFRDAVILLCQIPRQASEAVM